MIIIHNVNYDDNGDDLLLLLQSLLAVFKKPRLQYMQLLYTGDYNNDNGSNYDDCDNNNIGKFICRIQCTNGKYDIVVIANTESYYHVLLLS